MEKIIHIDGKDVAFKSTAGTPIKYQMQFKSDMLEDLQNLRDAYKDVKDNGKQFGFKDLMAFEKIA